MPTLDQYAPDERAQFIGKPVEIIGRFLRTMAHKTVIIREIDNKKGRAAYQVNRTGPKTWGPLADFKPWASRAAHELLEKNAAHANARPTESESDMRKVTEQIQLAGAAAMSDKERSQLADFLAHNPTLKQLDRWCDSAEQPILRYMFRVSPGMRIVPVQFMSSALSKMPVDGKLSPTVDALLPGGRKTVHHSSRAFAYYEEDQTPEVLRAFSEWSPNEEAPEVKQEPPTMSIDKDGNAVERAVPMVIPSSAPAAAAVATEAEEEEPDTPMDRLGVYCVPGPFYIINRAEWTVYGHPTGRAVNHFTKGMHKIGPGVTALPCPSAKSVNSVMAGYRRFRGDKMADALEIVREHEWKAISTAPVPPAAVLALAAPPVAEVKPEPKVEAVPLRPLVLMPPQNAAPLDIDQEMVDAIRDEVEADAMRLEAQARRIRAEANAKAEAMVRQLKAEASARAAKLEQEARDTRASLSDRLASTRAAAVN